MAIIRRGEPESERAISRGRSWDPYEVMQDLMRWDPFATMARGIGATGREFVPSFEVKETKDAYLFKADLPGVKEDDLDISLTGNRLSISGQREEEKKDESDQYYAYERSYGSFTRSFTLPDGVDVDNVNSELKDGVLSINVPKKPEVQPRRIQLKRGGEKEKAKA